ncbi:methyltransferase [Lentzea sp. NPDC051213]|uniref:methyltransferase n=1 Tax=Lentzea sp. NPDC051213 TaxID=3364126 RepID=UPI0037A58D7A
MSEPANLEALSDLATPWCVHVVATLRIAEHLTEGPMAADELAAAAGCDADSLARVMRHLVGKGVFVAPEPGRFALNDAARGLLDPARRISLDLYSVGGRMAHAWGTLLSVVRTGSPAYEELFGLPWWEDLVAHPAIAADFDALMGPVGHGTPDPEVLVIGDWESVRAVVDVGGGTGAMLTEILRAHPEVRGTLVDLPSTVARRPAGLAAVGQSFFDPLPAGADLYLLKSVLNDWPDREALAILTRCAEAAAPGGRVVVIGGVSPEGRPDGLTVEMVLLGGRSRTLDEFRGLAAQAGLVVEATGRQPTGRFVVQCRKA